MTKRGIGVTSLERVLHLNSCGLPGKDSSLGKEVGEKLDETSSGGETGTIR